MNSSEPPCVKVKIIVLIAGKIDDSGELTEKEIIRAERNSGVISNRVREIQVSVQFWF